MEAGVVCHRLTGPRRTDDGSATESETAAAAPGRCGAPNRNTAMLSFGDLVAEREVKGALTMVSWRLISL